MIAVHGRLEPVGDRWQLHFTRRLPHPPEKVWRALTEPEHLAAWFPTDIEGERAAGAPLRFVFRDGEMPPVDGEVITYDPPSALELRWGDENAPVRSATRRRRHRAGLREHVRRSRQGRSRRCGLARMSRPARLPPGRSGSSVDSRGAMARRAPLVRRALRTRRRDDRPAGPLTDADAAASTGASEVCATRCR